LQLNYAVEGEPSNNANNAEQPDLSYFPAGFFFRTGQVRLAVLSKTTNYFISQPVPRYMINAQVIACAFMRHDAIFRAIADPTRREILQLLRISDYSVKELTARFSMSQQGVSQHLSELRSARLVRARRFHRENRYRLIAASLAPVLEWLEGFRHLIDPAGHHWAIGQAPKAHRKRRTYGS
jgi:DNA-binding transcriptional ArsR family regulator